MIPLVLSLFDLTGNIVRPWAEAGVETLCVDMQHSLRRPKPGTVKLDLRTPGPLLVHLARHYARHRVIQVFAAPPCTDVAYSGARDFKLKGLRALAASIECFATATEVADILAAPYMIENPGSAIAIYWRDADYTFDPYQFAAFEPADHYTKQTYLWTGNGFVMPEIMPLFSGGPLFGGAGEPDDRIHKAPGPNRANIRSAAPLGFARAVFAANRHIAAPESEAA